MQRKKRTERYRDQAEPDSDTNPLHPVYGQRTKTRDAKNVKTESPHLDSSKMHASNRIISQGYYPRRPIRNEKAQSLKTIRKALFIIALCILIAVFAFSAYRLAEYIVQTDRALQDEAMIRDLISTSDSDSSLISQTGSPAPEAAFSVSSVSSDASSGIPALTSSGVSALYQPQATPAVPNVLIQFTKALAINPDTVGQLKMGESINTYVVQRDNTYYLRRSFTGEYSFSGAVFLDATCSIYPQSRNLILHGHNMQNGTAFGKLSRFDDIDYLNRFPIIYFSTLYEMGSYRPFAMVYYSVDASSDQYLDIYRINYISDQEFEAYIRKVKAMSEYRIPVYVTKSDKIITVTTCASSDPDIRFAVFAVKITNDYSLTAL